MFDSGLGGSQAGDRHAVGGAGHVVQANLVAELHGGGIAAVLAADTQVDVGAGLLAQLGGHGDQLAHAVLIQVGDVYKRQVKHCSIASWVLLPILNP